MAAYQVLFALVIMSSLPVTTNAVTIANLTDFNQSEAINYDVCDNGFCYKLYNFTEKANHTEASQFCQAHNMDLATIPSSSLQDKLMERLRAIPVSDEMWEPRPWTGLSLELVPNEDFVINTAQQFKSNIIWLEQPKVQSGDGCMLINRNGLKPIGCYQNNTNVRYICQTYIEPSEDIDCSMMREKFHNKWLCSNSQNLVMWIDAAKACAKIQGGGLLVVENSTMIDEMEKLLKSNETYAHSYYWTAFTKVLFVWNEASGIFVDPFSLTWDSRLEYNPHVQETIWGQSMCCTLSPQGMRSVRCEDGRSYAFCSKHLHDPPREIPSEIPSSSRTPYSTSAFPSTEANTRTSSSSTTPSNADDGILLLLTSPHNNALASTTQDLTTLALTSQGLTTLAQITQALTTQQTASNPSEIVEITQSSKSSVNYEQLRISVYVVCAVILVGLIVLIAILVRRKQRISKFFNVHKYQKRPSYVNNSGLATYEATYGDWTISRTADNEPFLSDTRPSSSTVPTVPTAPIYSEVVELKVSKYPTSHHIVCDEVTTFTDNLRSQRPQRDSTTNSLHSVPLKPQFLRPQTSQNPVSISEYATPDLDVLTFTDLAYLPPPPNELLYTSSDEEQISESLSFLPQSTHNQSSKLPLMKAILDPPANIEELYAKVDKTRIRCHSESPQLTHHQIFEPSFPRAESQASDAADSGIDDNAHSPQRYSFYQVEPNPSDQDILLETLIAKRASTNANAE